MRRKKRPDPMNGFVQFALGIANMPQATIAELDRSLPGFARLADEAKQIEPLLRQAAPLIQQASPHVVAMLPHIVALLPIAEKLMPLINAAWPIVQKAYPDIVAVTPTVEDLIAFVRAKSAS
jgi:hypothetical protein